MANNELSFFFLLQLVLRHPVDPVFWLVDVPFFFFFLVEESVDFSTSSLLCLFPFAVGDLDVSRASRPHPHRSWHAVSADKQTVRVFAC